MFCLLHQTTMLFDKHEHKYTAKNHEADNSFCACPQIYSVDSSFRSAQIFCSCPMNYSHAIYKGKEADELL